MLSSVATNTPYVESLIAENGTFHISATAGSIGLAARRSGIEHGALLSPDQARELVRALSASIVFAECRSGGAPRNTQAASEPIRR
jgi:hypothetical protein